MCWWKNLFNVDEEPANKRKQHGGMQIKHEPRQFFAGQFVGTLHLSAVKFAPTFNRNYLKQFSMEQEDFESVVRVYHYMQTPLLRQCN
jgi:hypothetical protein